MNAQMMARSAYASATAKIKSPRNTEYDAFARITRQLKASSATHEFQALARAIHDNRRLWTLLAADVLEPENELPAPIRARIVYLAEFVFQHSSKVLAGNATADALIDINKAIMRGLHGGEGNQ